jgi:transcriptional regulator with XRE-family HTH domain
MFMVNIMDVNNTHAWDNYFAALIGADSNAEAARKSGITEATLGRWKKGSVDPKPRQVVVIARAYNASPVEALIAAGYLHPDDIDQPAQAPRRLQITEFTELELAQELVRRIEAGEMRDELEDDVSGLPEDDVQSRYATAANTDFSADDLDPDTP